ncbi:hypothetical protein QMY03_09680 [Arthrobacter sp. KFRI-F3372]|nr:hypothetical protein QMY03_09680 [Arthrobacter sp. KFRI-F3372]
MNLDGPQSNGHKERVNAIAHFAAASSETGTFDFVQYKAEPVKQQLTLDFRKKCAYCESFVSHLTHPDIDHFRPKSAYRDASGSDVKPGYYWLASDWDNLFLSCHHCNRPSWQLLADGARVKVGKGTHFPLVDDSKRATGPGGEAAEDPLLLKPDQADVESHLEFLEDGVVVPAVVGGNESVKGRRSIDIYGLQRSALVSRRGAYLQRVKGTIVRYKRERRAYISSPNDSGVQERLKEAMKEIREYLCCRQEYLAMTRQYLAKECAELVQLPECTATSCIGSNF